MPIRKSQLTSWVTTPTPYLIGGVFLLGFCLIQWLDSIGGPEMVRERFGIAAPLATVPIHIVLAITPFPSDIIAMTNGAVYGLVVGAILSWIGWWIAALVEYGLGYRAREDFRWEDSRKRLPKWMQRFPVDHPVFLIGARQIPWLGGHITTFIPGAAGVRLGRYAWCSAIAIVPGSIVMPAIGAGFMVL